VQSVFSDTYLTTVGVKIDKKVVDVDGQEVALILWDIAGEDDVSTVRMSYLRGTAGYVLVADGTRVVTLDVVRSLHSRVEAEIGPVPFVLLLNKSDLVDEWTVSEQELQGLRDAGWSVRRTSAKSGEGVEDAFRELAVRLSA
jgi:hypothetical protein